MYSKEIQKMLIKEKIEIGDKILLKQNNKEYSGVLMPRPELGDENCLVIKLDNGYNIGIKTTDNFKIKILEKLKPIKKTVEKEKLEKGDITILGCGGTISSKVEYKTGAVYPAISQKELLSNFPEIKDITTINTRSIFSLLSGDLNQKHWKIIGEEIEKELKKDIEGIVISHGTDTMHYTSAALSFMIQESPVPIILTGAQRSSDRGSSDSKLNLLSSLMAAKSDFSEIGVCMHSNLNDNLCYVHKGTRVRKMHTSRRDAFKSINQLPILRIDYYNKTVDSVNKYIKKDKNRKPKINLKLNENIGLIYIHPGINPKFIEKLSDYDGIVLAGTGLGHVPTNAFNDKNSKSILKEIQGLIKSNIPVVMSPQTLYGRLNLNTYTYGRQLKQIGVIGHLCDWTPETAFTKLCWVLGHEKKMEKIKQEMETNFVGEITDRSVVL
ncbi:Glu-tRNA(Gln) amidotransferase subunit GatD [Candidatus Micrarchaeota archaeon]|nr:Glu-tRNA(Gln) amidotransferase subunit GatD [Candidatus Micrarchaeota archaeon]